MARVIFGAILSGWCWFCCQASIPDYGPPKFGGLNANCMDDECFGTVCDWLNLVAATGNFPSLAATRAFLDERLSTISAENWEYLRMPASLPSEIRKNYTDTDCTFAPRKAEFRPWRAALDGSISPNHKTIVNTSTGGNMDGVFIGNVYADCPGAETYHHHQQLSIFVHYGFRPCQLGIDTDGKFPTDLDNCSTTFTPDTPMTFEVLWTGPQWLHSNWLLPPMAWEHARNCPHDEAPSRYGDRGFMFRIFIPMNETDVLYPPAPNVTSRPDLFPHAPNAGGALLV